ncbi:uncharacterized protein LOC122857415 [Aphidius gifuensis]|uniref:uncharacterized protein LOC122857415 n=1 Tax=Aphidius gifuensis TaxID=684658 RepID=UPI001CDC32DD|nr:uncharacterized protein LOC122857415 [Aphidius gifuensis]
MGVAIKIEGRNATECVKTGQEMCYEAQKNYESTIELCYSVQREYLNANLLLKYHKGVNLEELLNQAASKCSINNFKIFKSGQSATCTFGELYYISPEVRKYLRDVKTVINSKKEIIKQTTNNLNMCYKKAWLMFLKFLDNSARNFTEECIAHQTGERPMKIKLN